MFSSLRQLLRGKPQAPLPAVPAGERVYAIGDIHGLYDLFASLVEAIEADDAERDEANGQQARTTVILLGDLVDRGPDSAGVLRLARDWQRHRPVRIIAGNHEEMMLAAMEQPEIMYHFLQYGGRETLLSLGYDAQTVDTASMEEAQDMLHDALAPDLLDFIHTFEDCVTIGDYAFVHAGVRPGVPLDAQTESDLRWIREPFLSHPGDHGAVVVHGHTITEQPVLRANRIGIDTGGYLHGVLTALCLEGTSQSLIQSRAVDGMISTTRTQVA